MSVQQMVERYLGGLTTAHYDAAEEVLHPDYEEYYPQTGEVLRGRGNVIASIEAHPGNPTGRIVDVQGGEAVEAKVTRALPMGPPVIHTYGGDDAFTAELLLDYPEAGRFHLICIGRLKDGLIHRTTMYWAEPDEAPEWRAPFAEIVSRD